MGMIEDIFQRIDGGEPLTKEDAVELLSIPNLSGNYYRLLEAASRASQRSYGNKGYIFVQVGLDSTPCRGNCRFCSLARDNNQEQTSANRSLEEVLTLVKQIDFTQVTALFLMTTAEYDQERFLDMARAIRAQIPTHTALVANTGDFDLTYAQKLRQAGVTGAYHVVRLREGSDTALTAERRIATLEAIKKTGLRLYYCVEPIGPEHSYEELSEEMLRAREYQVDVMAAMRRVDVPGTPFAGQGMIDDFEFAKIVAVTRLVVKPAVSMNAHEPSLVAMLGGVNQLYAEIGVNPRDCSRKTEESRGYCVDEAAKLLRDAGYVPCIEK